MGRYVTGMLRMLQARHRRFRLSSVMDALHALPALCVLGGREEIELFGMALTEDSMDARRLRQVAPAISLCSSHPYASVSDALCSSPSVRTLMPSRRHAVTPSRPPRMIS